MAALQEIPVEQVDRIVAAAVDAGVHVTVTARLRNRWMTYSTMPLAVHGGNFWVEVPKEAARRGQTFQPGERVSLSFRLMQQKYVFSGEVTHTTVVPLGDGTDVAAMGVPLPTEMHRIERRAHDRTDIPSARIVRASFWLGGKDAEPAGAAPDQPVWSGRVANLSEGGFYVRTSYEAGKCIEVGDIVGVRLTFAVDDKPVYADAQLRHCESDADMVLMGFEFVGMERSDEGMAFLELLRAELEECRQDRQEVATG